VVNPLLIDPINPGTAQPAAIPRPVVPAAPALPVSRLVEAAEAYEELEVAFDWAERACWCWMRPHGAPSFTPGMLQELIDLRRRIHHACRGDEAGLGWFVGGSRLPGIFNLGGDLGLFARLIREGARDRLTRYAHSCVDVCYHMATGFDVPVVTIALVQGDALGGGFEGAMSFNVIVAERSAKFGLPEILFNLFPGMGAYSFLSRRLDGIQAERIILGGRTFTAAELHDLGIVDVLAEDGEGERAVRDFIAEHRGRRAELAARLQARRLAQDLTHEELRDVTDIWVEAALRLTAGDLRKMERLVSAQGKRLGTAG
jgi:DSF synthase